MTAWTFDWLRAFVVTVAAEAAIAAPLLRGAEPRLARRLAAVALVNLATHPLVWFLFPGLGLGYVPRVAASELFALAVESAGYRVIWPALTPVRATGIAVLANGASWALGLVLRAARLI